MLLDIEMPGIDGRGARAAEGRCDLRHIPAITISGVDDTDAIVRLGAGADDFLPKPFDPAILRAGSTRA